MLSVILLVVLAGAAGLLAFSIAEGELPIRRLWRSDQTSVEAPGSDDTSAPPDDEDGDAETVTAADRIGDENADPDPDGRVETWSGALRQLDAGIATPPTPSPSPAHAAPASTAAARPSTARIVGRGPAPVPRGHDVPGSLTAVEGRWSELKTPWWRRVVSLVVLVGLLLVLSVLVAGVVGAVVGALAELLSGAIG